MKNVTKQNDNMESLKDVIFDALKDGKQYGTLEESFIAHAGSYGIENVEYLFPDFKNVDNEIKLIENDKGWVDHVLTNVSVAPFFKLKTILGDMSDETLRAKGYTKTGYKKEDVISLLKRETLPQTVYVKQRFDTDDLSDIQDYDVVSWIKNLMYKALKYELARAILIGDGRPQESPDKIKEEYIRPIYKDNNLFTSKIKINVKSNAEDSEIAKKFIEETIKSRPNYKGNGMPVLYADEMMITKCLLLEDRNGRKIYETVNHLATILRVKDIITISGLEEYTKKTTENNTSYLAGLYGSISDYTIGVGNQSKKNATKPNFIEKFDINYNQRKFLTETRLSGALTEPMTFVSLEVVEEIAKEPANVLTEAVNNESSEKSNENVAAVSPQKQTTKSSTR